MFGDYLLFIPAIAYLWRTLRTQHEVFVDVISSAGFAFAVVGGTGACVLAIAGAPLISAYANASTTLRPAIKIVFATLMNTVTGGIWQTLVALLIGTWLIGLAVVLRRRWVWFARYSLVLGVVGILGSLGHMLGMQYEGREPDTLIFLPINIWLGWLAVLLWRRSLVDRARGPRLP
jgi:hypothetical protein